MCTCYRILIKWVVVIILPLIYWTTHGRVCIISLHCRLALNISLIIKKKTNMSNVITNLSEIAQMEFSMLKGKDTCSKAISRLLGRNV